MLTQCPACHTSFQVTGGILRAAHGQVRCGHCNTQFDAIEHLIDNESPDAAAANVAASKGIIVEEPVAEEITLEGSRIEISGTYRTVREGDEPRTETIVQEFTVAEEPEMPVADAADSPIVTEDNGGSAHDAALPPPAAPPASAADDEAGPLQRRSMEPFTAARRDWRPGAGSVDDFGAAAIPHGWWWPTLATVMALALIAQIINHYRQDLARRADVGPHLTRIYTVLGLPLEPRWELSAYALKQWGVISDPGLGGALRVRASIANNAPFAQPYPLLKLTLEDRFGMQVGSREFKPEEYLPSANRAKRLLDARQSVNADIAIVDPGEEAVGFQLNVCLPGAQSSRCAD